MPEITLLIDILPVYDYNFDRFYLRVGIALYEICYSVPESLFG